MYATSINGHLQRLHSVDGKIQGSYFKDLFNGESDGVHLLDVAPFEFVASTGFDDCFLVKGYKEMMDFKRDEIISEIQCNYLDD